MKRRMDVKSELVELGLSVREVHLNLPPAELTARALAREEGILVGISSGATLAAIAQKLKDAPGGRPPTGSSSTSPREPRWRGAT